MEIFYNNTNHYVNILPDLVEDYNDTRHSSIKMTPVEEGKKKNELTVWRNLYPEHLEIRDIKPIFSIGDKVRISKKKKTFQKRIYHKMDIRDFYDRRSKTYIARNV